MENKSTQLLRDLNNELYDSNMVVGGACYDINKLFQQVVADLCPLSNSFMLPPPDYYMSKFFINHITVELNLSCVRIHKAPGPDAVPN